MMKNTHVVPVPFKQPELVALQPTGPMDFLMETWITAPPNSHAITWIRVTKETEDYIIHYLCANEPLTGTTQHAERIEYVWDILVLRRKGGVVINVDDGDVDFVLDKIAGLL